MGLIRVFLAFVVALGHLRAIYLPNYNINPDNWYVYCLFGLNSGYAVFYFYIISGFLISYTLTHNHPETRDGTIEYLKSRFIRIFSLYWPMFAICSLVTLFITHTPLTLTLLSRFTGLFLVGSDWYVAFARYPDQAFDCFPDFLGQAWSLGAELTFYILAPFLVRSLTAAVCIFLFSLATRLSFVWVYGWHSTWTYHFFPAAIMFFLLGHFAQRFGDRLVPYRWWGLAFLLASVVTSTVGISTQKWDNANFYIAILFFALSLPGIFELTKRSKIFNFIGDLSYPIYLTHICILSLMFGTTHLGHTITRLDVHHGLAFLPGLYTFITFIIITIIGAILVHWIIEQPTALLFKKILRVERSKRRS